MFIKLLHNRAKKLQSTAGFFLLEVVLAVGFVLFAVMAATSLHGLIMYSYRSTDCWIRAVSCAENVLAYETTGVSETVQEKLFTVTSSRAALPQFVPSDKGSRACSLVTVRVAWQEQGKEQSVSLSRVSYARDVEYA